MVMRSNRREVAYEYKCNDNGYYMPNYRNCNIYRQNKINFKRYCKYVIDLL